MSHFFNLLLPLAVIALVYTYLWIIGLPVTLACLPRERLGVAVLMAPLTAISLLSLAHQYLFFFFLRPYSPLVVHLGVWAVVTASFLLVMRWRRLPLRTVLADVMGSIRAFGVYALVPALWLIVFCALFWRTGLQMLSAGEDEFAYVEVTRQLMTAVNTGSVDDVPFARSDHYLGDFNGRNMVYFGYLRLAVNYVMADVSAVTRLPLELTFPILCGLFILIAIVALPSTLALFFRLPQPMSILGQLTFAFSALLIILHFQGSLSHLASMGFRLSGLAVIIWGLALSTSVGSLILAVILALGWLMTYYESAGFGLVVPLCAVGVVAAWRTIRERGYRPWYFLRVAVVLGTLQVVLPKLVDFVIDIYQQDVATDLDSNGAVLQAPMRIASQANALMSNYLPSMLGLSGFYDQSAINAHFYLLIFPRVSLILFLILILLSAMGFCRLPLEWMAGYAVIPLSLGAIALAAAAKNDPFISMRAVELVTPYLMLGTICLISSPWCDRRLLASSSRKVVSSVGQPVTRHLVSALRPLGLSVATLLVGGLFWCNASAVWRTTAFINSHSIATDPIVRRFDPEASIWHELRAELASPDGAPFLLSGFDNTPIPHWLALATRPLPHLLGTSVTGFWSAMSPTYSIPPVTHSISFYISVFSQDQLKALLADSPVSHWDVTYPRLLAETRKAVVPISGGYPIEWGIWRQLAGSESVRFTNVCDVVSRDALPSVIIDSRQPAVADTDSLGPYWTLQDGVVRPKIDAPVTGVMEVRYNGPPPHVAISGVVGATAPLTANVDKQAVLRVTGRFDAQSRLTIESDAGTRFRAITFYRFP